MKEFVANHYARLKSQPSVSDVFLSASQWTVLCDANSSVMTILYHCHMDLQLKGGPGIVWYRLVVWAGL